MNTAVSPPRRREFACSDAATVREILQAARCCHLTQAGQTRPLNFALVGQRLYFHTSPQGALSDWRGPASVCVEDGLCWLPSYWRNQKLACPATTYYRSVIASGELSEVVEREEKAVAMQALMEKLQPEGGHLPLTSSVYKGPLDALCVLSLELQQASCKVKFGQHLNSAQRRRIHEALLERGAPGDYECARSMRRYNADLGEIPQGWSFDRSAIEPEQLFELLHPTYWAGQRSLPEFAEQLRLAWITVGFWSEGRLVAYARLHRFARTAAYLYDVIVAPHRRGQGLGREMLSRLLDHPQLEQVERILLDTRDQMPLYEKFGFQQLYRRPNGSLHMVKELRG